MIVVKVRDRDIKAAPMGPVTTGSVGLPVRWHFSEEWDDLAKTAVFRVGNDGTEITVAVLEDLCLVPDELLVQANAGENLWIGVYGWKGTNANDTIVPEIAMPTIWTYTRIQDGSQPSGIEPPEGTPGWSAQIQNATDEALRVAHGVAADAAEGDFDGISPAVTISSITHGHSVTITDRDHPTGQSFNVMDGDSAYEQAVAGGYTGTEAQFNEELASFKELSDETKEAAPFYAEYGVTTRAEIEAAINDKRQIYLLTAPLVESTPQAYVMPLIEKFEYRYTDGGRIVIDRGYRFSITSGTNQYIAEIANGWTVYTNDLSAPAASAEAAAAQALIRMNSADQSAQSAAGSASNASRDAGTASTAATTATTKAGEASDSATAADGSAKDAEAYAIGKRNGTDVGSTDPAYHNNAKYYAEQASGSATAASGSATSAASSATAAGNAQTAAETAQAAAEDAQEAAEAVLASIPADYTELTEDVSDLKSALYTEESSPNLLYLNTVKQNYYISNTNGQEVAYNNWGATDYIPVVGGESYVFIGCYSVGGMYEYMRTDYYAFYDTNKEYISGGFNSRGTITAPDNAKYIRESANLPAFTSAMYATMFGLNSDLGSFVGQKTKADYIEPSSELVPSEFLTDTVKNVIGKTITVEKDGTGDYTTLKDAVEYSASHEDTTILVGSGTYDLITEFGASYFADMTTSNHRQGLQIGNGVHIIFSSGAKVTAHYTGSNDAVKTCFSPFNFIQGSKGFTLENLTIEASNVRYCVHDEAGNTSTPNHYKNVYKNCRMQIDNSKNSAWSHHQCIGGGLGLHGEIIIEDSVFTDLYNINYRVPAVSYHNALGDGAKSRIVVKGCWFSANATVRVSWYGTSTEITEAIIHDNSCTVAPYVNAENESSVVENVTLYSWNNEIRT